MYWQAVLIYFLAVSLMAIALTLYDKFASKTKMWRVRENMLLIVAFLGGAATMYSTMLLIRHKTKHVKFMLGVPVIIILQAVAIFGICSLI